MRNLKRFTTIKRQVMQGMRKASVLALVLVCMSGMGGCGKKAKSDSDSKKNTSKTEESDKANVSDAGETMLQANHIKELMQENDTLLLKTETDVDGEKQSFCYYIYHEDDQLKVAFQSVDAQGETVTTMNTKDGAAYINTTTEPYCAIFPDEDIDAAVAAFAEGYFDYDEIVSEPVLEDDMYVVEGSKLFEESDYYCNVKIKYYFDAKTERIQKIEAIAYDESEEEMYSQITTFDYQKKNEVDNSSYEKITSGDDAEKLQLTFVINPESDNPQKRTYTINKNIVFTVYSDTEGNAYTMYSDEECTKQFDSSSEIKEDELTLYVKKS